MNFIADWKMVRNGGEGVEKWYDKWIEFELNSGELDSYILLENVEDWWDKMIFKVIK